MGVYCPVCLLQSWMLMPQIRVSNMNACFLTSHDRDPLQSRRIAFMVLYGPSDLQTFRSSDIQAFCFFFENNDLQTALSFGFQSVDIQTFTCIPICFQPILIPSSRIRLRRRRSARPSSKVMFNSLEVRLNLIEFNLSQPADLLDLHRIRVSQHEGPLNPHRISSFA